MLKALPANHRPYDDEYNIQACHLAVAVAFNKKACAEIDRLHDMLKRIVEMPILSNAPMHQCMEMKAIAKQALEGT